MSMRLLITGANGFIGRNLVACLPARTTYWACNRQNFDMHNLAAVSAALEEFRPTHCIHLAWYAGAGYADAQENLDWLTSSLHLIKEFYACGGKRFVGIGSCFEYAFGGKPCDEYTTPTFPITLYGMSKLAVMQFLRAYAVSKGASYAWCRPFYILGPGEVPRRLIPSACTAFSQGKVFKVAAYHRLLDYMDVRDVATAIMRISSSDYDGVINISSGFGVSVGSLLMQLAEIAHTPDCIEAETSNGKFIPIIGCNDILKNCIDFVPQYKIQTSLLDCYTYMRERI